MDTFGPSAMGALFFMLFSLEREPEVLAEEEAEEAEESRKEVTLRYQQEPVSVHLYITMSC